MARNLVAYHSRTGITRQVALALVPRLAADLLEIRDVRPRDGMLGYLRSALEAMQASLPEIAPVTQELAGYDLIVLGTPVWVGHVSSPMRRFLRDHGQRLRRVAFFCTMGERGAESTFQQMRDLLGRDAEATLALTDRTVCQERHLRSLDEFAARLLRSCPAATATAAEIEPASHVPL
jgi:menaquinone-dependent protoporphyrinogen IX oxidase